MNSLWKQLRNVRDDVERDASTFSVAQLMATPTPPKYLAYRLSPKMEEYLIFMMVRSGSRVTALYSSRHDTNGSAMD